MSRKQGKRNLHKQERKRRAERAKRRAQPTPLAYRGNKYRTDELVEIHLFTESGILHADAASGRRLTDPMVESALEELIHQLRHGPLELGGRTEASDYQAGQEQELILESIRLNWQHLAARNALPGRDSLVGVLRSVLGSIETWKTPAATSRGYLEYLEDFLAQVGVSAESTTVEQLDEIASDEVEGDDEEDFEFAMDDETSEALFAELVETADLFLLGQVWYREEYPAAEMLFRTIAERRINSGEAAEVAKICRQLIAESPRRSVNADLTALALQAERALQASAHPK